jgi:hypothetical protein
LRRDPIVRGLRMLRDRVPSIMRGDAVAGSRSADIGVCGNPAMRETVTDPGMAAKTVARQSAETASANSPGMGAAGVETACVKSAAAMKTAAHRHDRRCVGQTPVHSSYLLPPRRRSPRAQRQFCTTWQVLLLWIADWHKPPLTENLCRRRGLPASVSKFRQ